MLLLLLWGCGPITGTSEDAAGESIDVSTDSDLSDEEPSLCPPGFRPHHGGCIDIDECAEGTSGCDPDRARCVNTGGGFVCDCPPGFLDIYGDASRCECPASMADCDGELDTGCEAIAPCIDWTVSFGGPGSDGGSGAATDDDGNVYVTGIFQYTANFGGEVLSAEGFWDGFVAAVAPGSWLRWLDGWSDLGEGGRGRGLAFQPGLGVAVVGGHLHYAGYRVDGAPLWERALTEGNSEYLGVAVGPEGAVWAVGGFAGTLEIAGQVLVGHPGEDDFLLSRLRADGSHSWSLAFGGEGGDFGVSVAVDRAGNVYVAGYVWSDVVDLGAGPIETPGDSDVFVASYTAEGRHRWSHVMGGRGYDAGRAIAVDPNGNVYVTGSFNDTVDFGDGPLVSSGGHDVFLASYTSDGALRWSDGFGGPDLDEGRGIAIDRRGNVLVTGSYVGSTRLGGEVLTGWGGYDIFVASYTPTGEHRWSRGFGASGADVGAGVACDARGGIYVTGQFSQTVAFGGDVVRSAGDSDVFLLRLHD